MSNNLDPELKEELDLFIENNVIASRVKSLNIIKKAGVSHEPTTSFGHAFGNFDFTADLDARINKVKSTQTLGEYIEELYQKKRKDDPNVLRKAGIDRAYKYKVVNNRIHPTKSKLLCFAIAFELDLDGTEKLLNKAGYTLTEENNVFDSIIGYFIEKGYYFGADIDICLEEYGQPTIFSVA
ncbi:hypothetical protein [Bacillus sp. PS06]|uniref:hypothetical protein n=1 Tax=Bacillus sp. PS06 TaxID=2764176 RepID=UPI00177C68A8|nr:hypothetical protein [Bacillus sp. PS06]MBD8069775.1 hypothetical protein [Bacillus sp. PS06]